MTTIYHNPRCSKSRAVLEILHQRGETLEIIDYLKTPLQELEIFKLLEKLQITDPRQIMRKGEAVYKQLGLGQPSVSPEALIAAIAANPVLLERPIVVTATGAAICRPPERVRELLGWRDCQPPGAMT